MSTSFDIAMMSPDGQLALQALKDRLDEYVTKMAPGRPISSDDGAFQQRQLWHGVVNHLLKQTPQVFLVGWAEFLKVVLENRKGCFSPQYLHRFQDSVKLTMVERRNLQRLLHLAYVTCDPSARRLSLKQVDLNHILSTLSDEGQRQKLIAFYEI